MTVPYTIAIPKEQLAEMPLVEFADPITIIDTPAHAREVLARLSSEPIVGFDTETRPNFRKGQNHQVALIQISIPGESYLFRICRFGLIREMIDFFENPDVTKIGLSLKDDFHNLHKYAEFMPAGFIELQQMVKDYAITDTSLQKIFGILFGERISKGQRLSNWEAESLSPAQQHYAAIDSWACLKIYNHLLSGAFNPAESPYKVYPQSTE